LPDLPLGDHADRCSTGLAVHGALATLTARQRDILTRCYLLDHSDSDIAVALGISPVTVRTLRRRGLAHLRRLMSEGSRAEGRQ
jgi:DNA-directed RNA polymerase specialized sigma24 family protein